MTTTKGTDTTSAVRRYRVTAVYATCSTGAAIGLPGRGGRTVVGIDQDGLIPADALDSEIEHLLSIGFIEPVEEVV
jgi:hypothetical protein